MIFKDYYKILGLDTSKATNEEIKLAYRERLSRLRRKQERSHLTIGFLRIPRLRSI